MNRISAAATLCFSLAFAFVSEPAWAGPGVLSIVSVEPTPGSLDADTSAAIVVHFDRPVVAASAVPLRSFWAFGRWSGSVAGTILLSNGDQTVTLVPDQPFSAGENVTVFLSHRLRGQDATSLRPAGYSFQFWTRAEPGTLEFVEVERYTTRSVPTVSSRAYGGIGSDLDGDRYLDITIVNEDTADLRVFLNHADGTATFADFAQPPYPVGNRASPSEPADFDRDGDVDICVANINDGTVSILLGNGDGSFAPQQLVGVGLAPRGIAVVDADGDGDVDIVNTNSGSDNLSILINDGTGLFGPPVFFEGGGSGEWALTSADMTGDGILDLVVGAQNGQSIVVLAGNGDGTFSVTATQASGGPVWMLSAGDLDGDGHADVTGVNSATSSGAILFGDGSGQLSPPAMYAIDSFPLATDLGDIDGDGDLDWITSSFQGDWMLFVNDGAGTFTLERAFPAVLAASCALMLDADNDGDLDLALIDELEDEVIVVRNACLLAEATAWYRDADGDGFGDAGVVSMACSQPAGFTAEGTDCSDADAAIWAAPGETRDLRFEAGGDVLSWDAPAAPGALLVAYDTLRSTTAGGFLTASCVEADDAADTQATDVTQPSNGQALYYLVRAENTCSPGAGPLGSDSDGAQRPGRTCP